MLSGSATSSGIDALLFVGVLCVASAVAVAGALVLCQRTRLDASYERLQARLRAGWVARDALSIAGLVLLVISAVAMLGGIEPVVLLSPGLALVAAITLLGGFVALAIALPADTIATTTAATQTGDGEDAHDARRAA